MNYQRQDDVEELERKIAEDKKLARRKRIRKFFIGLAISWLISIGLVTLFLKIYLDPIVKTKIEEKGSAVLGAPLKIGEASVRLLPTPNMTLRGVEFSAPQAHASGTVKTLTVALGASVWQLATGGALGIANLELEQPKIDFNLPAPSPQSTSGAASESNGPLVPQIRFNRDLGVRLRVLSGILNVKRGPDLEAHLENLNLTVDIPSINKTAATAAVRANANIKKGEYNVRFPLDLQSKVTLDENLISLSQAKGDLFGFSFTADGWQDIVTGRADWKLTGHIPELANVPVPPSFLPPGKWNGKIAAAISAQSPSKAKGWSAKAQLDVTQLKGTTKVERNGWTGDGAVAGNASFDLTVDPRSDFAQSGSYAFQLNKGYLAADLTDMVVTKPKLFSKPKAVPLVFYFSGAGNPSSVRIEKIDLKFANLALHSAGLASLDAGRTSALSITVERTDLSGWEAYLPPLSKAPVKGNLQLNAEIKGDLQKPEGLSLRLDPLLLEKFEAAVDWTSEDQTLNVTGPMRANVRADLTAIGTELRGASVKLESDLTGLSIIKKDTFTKKSGFPLSINVQGEQKGQQVEIRSSNIRLGTGAFNVTGRVANPQRPNLDLKLNAPSLNLAELATLSPKAASFGVSGNASAALDLGGLYDFQQGLTKSPLKLRGQITARIPSYKMVRAKPVSPGSATPVPAPTSKPEPLLPDWPIARSAQVKSDVTVAEFNYGDLPVRGIHALVNLVNGDVDGSVTVDQVFAGRVKVPRFRSRLTSALPDSTADIEYTSINLQEAAAFASPDWRELVKGSATGKTRALVPYPSSSTFVDRLRAAGNVVIKNGFVSTVRLDQLVNENLAKVPGLANQALVNSKGVTADISTDYTAEKKTLDLKNFVFITPEKNELRANGTLGFDKSINLSGTGYLATAPVGGSVRSANSDPQGRLVVPLKIQGNLMKPEVSFANETVQQLLRKTAEQELKKGVQKKLDDLQENIKKKGLEGLKDLFK